MNKIVIIGNGFDLAHGLKTSYKDLMNFIKEDANLDSRKAGDCGNIHYDLDDENNYITFRRHNTVKVNHDFTTCGKNPSIYFTQLFIEYNKYEKWVDLESLYFRLIKENSTELKNINLINKEFNYLKKLLEKYLSEEVENKLPDYHRDFRECFFYGYQEEKLLGLINFNYTNKVINYHFSALRSMNEDYYHSNFSRVNIHGELKKIKNPIIFGYGDDNSNEYKSIQAKEKKELLINFKTFQYLRTSNYHKVLAMLELEKDIKIEIIGHSCGLSDKTLLKTIFQHPNVKKIEFRYHDNEEKYFENIYNISRIFDDNILMRKKIVSLSETEIIPKLNIEL